MEHCVIVAGASPGETTMWAAVRETAIFCTCGSNNWETVEHRWVDAARGLASTIVFSFIQRFAYFVAEKQLFVSLLQRS